MGEARYSYRDLSHPSYQEALQGHNAGILRLVKTVAEFVQEVSIAHEDFAGQVQQIVETFQEKNKNLKSERPAESNSSLNKAWETLLQETHYDAQAHLDAASLLMKNVYTPLAEISSSKTSQCKKLTSFRDHFENILCNAGEGVKQAHLSCVDSYQNYRGNLTGRDAHLYASNYYNSHNEYILQIHATNRQEQEFHENILPYLLEELQEIHIDVANTLTGSLESHALLLLTKANEQTRRFDNILRASKQVHPKHDVNSYLGTVCHQERPLPYEPVYYSFIPPSDPDIPGSELGALKAKIVLDKLTEPVLQTRRVQLQKEAAEFTSYLKQNQDITQTLINVCQRNSANHLYAKVYETQEDLCRKRNDIRTANFQLSSIRAQIDLLQQKQNGAAVEGDQESTASSKSSKASIKGMWKKAFKSLKTTKEPKDKEQQPHKDLQLTQKEKSVKERERLDSDSTDKMEDKPKYSRMMCFYYPSNHSPPPSPSSSSTHSACTPPPRSPRTPTTPRTPGDSPRRTQSTSSFQSLLNRNPGIGTMPAQIYADWQQTSRQSSLQKKFGRKDSKDSPTSEVPEQQPVDSSEIDPVYSLLKCAAQKQTGVPGNKTMHGCCVRTNQSNNDLGSVSIATTNPGTLVRSNSRSSSPSSDFFDGPDELSTASTFSNVSQKAADNHLKNSANKGLYSGKVVTSTSCLSGVPMVTVDTKHITKDTLSHWDNDHRLLMEAHSLSTAKRRVRFQQESQKSKSLETPYHHTHEQHKLNADMADVQERSSSYSSIPQRAPGNTKHSHILYSAPPEYINCTDPNRLSQCHAAGLLRFRQRSFSADDLSPSSTEQEKWEQEAHRDQIWKDGIRNQEPKQQDGRRLTPTRKGAPLLSSQQRSFSAGDISPSYEKWENEASEGSTKSSEASAKNLRITFMKDSLNRVQSSYPTDIKIGQPGHSWGEIMAQLPSGRQTIEMTKRQVRQATLKEPHSSSCKSDKSAATKGREPEHRTRKRDKEEKPLSPATSNLEQMHPPDRGKRNGSIGQGPSAFSRRKSFADQKQIESQMEVKTSSPAIIPVAKDKIEQKNGKQSVRQRRESTNSPSSRGSVPRVSDTGAKLHSRGSSQRIVDQNTAPQPNVKRLEDSTAATTASRSTRGQQSSSKQRTSGSSVVKSPPITAAAVNYSAKSAPHDQQQFHQDRNPSQKPLHSYSMPYTREVTTDNTTAATLHSAQSVQMPLAVRESSHRERSQGGGMCHMSSQVAARLSTVEPTGHSRSMREHSPHSSLSFHTPNLSVSPTLRVKRPKTLVRQKEINAHIRPMDYRGTQEHIKQKRQLMLEQRKSRSFESSFEDHFFHDLKYNGMNLKELKDSAKSIKDNVGSSRNAKEKRLLMVKDRTERKSNSLDSSFEVVNPNEPEVFYDAPSSFYHDDGSQLETSAEKTARQKRLHQFKEQKSYSFECPPVMEKFLSKTHVRVEDLRRSDLGFNNNTRPRRELPAEPDFTRRRTSSGSPRSPQSRGSPHSPHSPRSPSGRGSPRSPQGQSSPHSPRSPSSHAAPHSPKSPQRKTSPRSKDGQSRERSASVSHKTRDHSTCHQRDRLGSGQSKERSPVSPRTQSGERVHVSPYSSRGSREQSLNEPSRHSSPANSRESSLSKSRGSINQSKGSMSQSREQSVRHSRDRSPYHSHEQSLTGSKEFISPRQSHEYSLSHFRDISPRQSVTLSRDASPKTSRDRLSYSRESNTHSREAVIRSREQSPFQSGEVAFSASKSDVRRSKGDCQEGASTGRSSNSNDAIPGDAIKNRRDCFQQQKSYSIDLPPSRDPYVEQEKYDIEQSICYVTSPRFEGLAPLKEYRESLDSHDEKSLQAYIQHTERSPISSRRQHFQQQKSYSLDSPYSGRETLDPEVHQQISYTKHEPYTSSSKEHRYHGMDVQPCELPCKDVMGEAIVTETKPCVIKEPIYSESEPTESKCKRMPQAPVDIVHYLKPQSSDARRTQLLKQKSKSIDVPYIPEEAKQYSAKILERRSYDHATKREYSKEFDLQLRRVIMSKRAMTIDPNDERRSPSPVIKIQAQAAVPKAHKMRTFREQKSYSIDVPDKSNSYQPEYQIRRERSPSQGQAQRPVVTFQESRKSITGQEVPSSIFDSSKGAIPKVPIESSVIRQKRKEMLKPQSGYSVDIPMSQVQRHAPEVRAVDSGIGISSERTLDILPDGHLEPNITVLDPESPPYPKIEVVSGAIPKSKRLEQYGKQKSYSIDVPPSVDFHDMYDQYCGHEVEHTSVKAWRKKRENFFQHQKSHSVDVPSAEMASGDREYSLPERKVESDSKILVHQKEKRPTHKRLQFLRYLTEQGTLSFDDGGKPLSPLDIIIKPADQQPQEPSLSSSQERIEASQTSLSSTQTSNKNRRKSLFALHNMKALADIPHSGESTEEASLIEQNLLPLCDSGVVFDEPVATAPVASIRETIVISSSSASSISSNNNHHYPQSSSVLAFSDGSNSRGSAAGAAATTTVVTINTAPRTSSPPSTATANTTSTTTTATTALLPTTESSTELKGILKNKDDPIYIKEKEERETSWKWRLFACAEFLADKRTELILSPLAELPADYVECTRDSENQPFQLSPLSEELKRYILYDSQESLDRPGTPQKQHKKGRKRHRARGLASFKGSLDSISTTDNISDDGSQRSPGVRRKKRLGHSTKSFSVDASSGGGGGSSVQSATEETTSTGGKKSSLTTTQSHAGCFGGTSSPSRNTSQGTRSTFSLFRFLNSFVNTQGSNSNSVQHKRNRFFSRQASSLDVEVSQCQNSKNASSTSPQRSRSILRSVSVSNSPRIPRRNAGNVFIAMYAYKPRERDDLDLKAGSRVITLDTSDPDWWKGKCLGRVGYFPSNYVTKLNPGERAMQVLSGLEIMEGEESIKLLKEQIVIQEGMADDGMVMIRTGTNRRVPCPVKYLTDVEVFKKK